MGLEGGSRSFSKVSALVKDHDSLPVGVMSFIPYYSMYIFAKYMQCTIRHYYWNGLQMKLTRCTSNGRLTSHNNAREFYVQFIHVLC